MTLVRLAAFIFAFAVLPAQAIELPENHIDWRPGLRSSAQPKQAFLEHLKDEKVELLINLAPPQSYGSIELEGAIAGKQGLVYVNIPVNWDAPQAADFDYFVAAMRGADKRNVYVHCQANFRASSFVMLYRVIVEGAPVEETLAKLTAVWSPNATWKAFIRDTFKRHGKDVEIF